MGWPTLFGRVTKDALCAPIPASDNAIEIFTDNCIVTRFHDGSQRTQSLFAFAKRSFDLLPLSDVGGDVDQTMRLTVRFSIENASVAGEPPYLPIRLNNSVLGWEGVLSISQGMI